MVKKCCVSKCKSESYGGCGISFHSFPKNEETKQKWINVIPMSQKCTKNSVICHLHFKPEDMCTAKSRQCLKSDVIPSIFPKPTNKQINVLSTMTVQPPYQPIASSTHSSTQMSSMIIAKPGTSTSEQPPPKKMCVDIKHTAVQTEKKYSSPSEDMLKRKVRILSQKLNRRDTSLKSLKSILDTIKRKRSGNCDEVANIMENNFKDIHNHINTDKSNKGIRYSEELKKFALTLYYYSTKSYLFLRNKIALPHPATLRKMLASHECNVGFMTEVFEYLKLSVTENNLQNVALIFDAMSIRKEEAYDKINDKKWGYVDLSGIVPHDSECLASEVLVLQIVSFQRKFKCPVAYFLIDKISAAVQTQLITTAIRMLFDIGIIVKSLTCDGTSANVSTYENLGCNFNYPDMVTNFRHPKQDCKIHCIFDPAHMLKLCRNVFAETNLNSENGRIDFRYVTELHNLQEEEGLKLANKINATHINFFGKKMNVRLAAQTLSSSVANAIDFLRISGNEKFNNSEATTEYIKIVDRLFDVLNAKSPLAKGFKAPLRLSNKDYWTRILVESREYLAKLNIDNQNILSHRRKMAAFGFIVNTYSTLNLAMELLENNLNYFLPYKFSQDHLEMFFSCVRLQGGANNNPNALQFRYAMRKLLYRNSIKPSMNGNCTDDDFQLSPILEYRTKKRSILENPASDLQYQEDHHIVTLLSTMNSTNISDYKMNVLYYIAGHFVNKLLNKISCQYCHNALITSKQNFDHSYFVDITNFSSFTAFIDRGGLKYVSKFAFEVIKCSEKLFILELGSNSFKNTSKNRILMTLKQMFFTKLNHLFDPPHPVECIMTNEPHELQLVKSLANSYLNLRIFHTAKSRSLRNLGNKIGLRQKLHKTILFSHL